MNLEVVSQPPREKEHTNETPASTAPLPTMYARICSEQPYKAYIRKVKRTIKASINLNNESIDHSCYHSPQTST